ncbi:MAG: class I SAM-dependent methyltransferase [Defluviitaleaceae bacterium]|nr:class I SAM-dependent methyltransferase [Defluviitaleaceae bacterium]
MEIYGEFARVYDQLMEAPYLEWAEYIEELWLKFELKPNLILDLACGTGVLTDILASRGYDMIGADLSADMLMVARETNPEILWLQQDMREFELYGSVDAVICICDSLNYILEPEELAQVFKQVQFYLNPGGLFVFDINTEYKYSQILADNDFSGVGDSGAYIWENFYCEEERINEYQVTLFVGDENGLYSRYEEVHVQKAHKIGEIKNALRIAGLEILGEFDELTLNPPHHQSERVFFVARKT